jgi:hypothetical protein
MKTSAAEVGQPETKLSSHRQATLGHFPLTKKSHELAPAFNQARSWIAKEQRTDPSKTRSNYIP